MANVSYQAISGGTKTIIRSIGNSTDVIVVGNSAASNLTGNSTETVISAMITKINYGCPANAYWAVYRGANIVACCTGTGTTDYILNTDTTANITANLVGGSVGFIAIEVAKQSKFN